MCNAFFFFFLSVNRDIVFNIEPVQTDCVIKSAALKVNKCHRARVKTPVKWRKGLFVLGGGGLELRAMVSSAVLLIGVMLHRHH